MTWSTMPLAVTQTNQMNVSLEDGKINVECWNDSKPNTKVSVANLTVSGLTVVNDLTWTVHGQPGFVDHIDSMDTSQLQVHLTAPRLPVSEAKETQLVAHLLQQNKDSLNKLLLKNAMTLPQSVQQYFANPQAALVYQQGNHGYMELSEFCQCGSTCDFQCTSRQRRDTGGSIFVNVYASKCDLSQPGDSMWSTQLNLADPGCQPGGLVFNNSLWLYCNSSCGDCMISGLPVEYDTCVNVSGVFVTMTNHSCMGGFTATNDILVVTEAAGNAYVSNWGTPGKCHPTSNSTYAKVSKEDDGSYNLHSQCNDSHCQLCADNIHNVTNHSLGVWVQRGADACAPKFDSHTHRSHHHHHRIFVGAAWVTLVLGGLLGVWGLYQLYCTVKRCRALRTNLNINGDTLTWRTKAKDWLTQVKDAVTDVKDTLKENLDPGPPDKVCLGTWVVTIVTCVALVLLVVGVCSVFYLGSSKEIHRLGFNDTYIDVHRLRHAYSDWDLVIRLLGLLSLLIVATFFVVSTFFMGGHPNQRKWNLANTLLLGLVVLLMLLGYLLTPYVLNVQKSVKLTPTANLTNNEDIKSGVNRYLQVSAIGFTYSFVCHVLLYVQAAIQPGLLLGALVYIVDHAHNIEFSTYALRENVVDMSSVVVVAFGLCVPVSIAYPLLVEWHTLSNDPLYITAWTLLLVCHVALGLWLTRTHRLEEGVRLMNKDEYRYCSGVPLMLTLFLVCTGGLMTTIIIREGLLLQSATIALHNAVSYVSTMGLTALTMVSLLRYTEACYNELEPVPDATALLKTLKWLGIGLSIPLLGLPLVLYFMVKALSDWIERCNDSGDRQVLKRRTWLLFGALFMTAVVAYKVYDVSVNTSWKEVLSVLEFVESSMSVPPEDSIVKPAVDVNEYMRITEVSLQGVAVLLLWLSLLVDRVTKGAALGASRLLGYAALLLIIGSSLLTSIPDYVSMTPLSRLCPFCANKFNFMVTTLSENVMGTLIAEDQALTSLFVELGLVPSVVRVCELLLVDQSSYAVLFLFRVGPIMSVLMLGSGAMFGNMVLGDAVSKWLTLCFFVLPLLCTLTARITRVTVHYLAFMVTYVGSFLALVIYEGVVQDIFRQRYLSMAFHSSAFYMLWIEIAAEWCIANVVVGDILCSILV